MSTSPVILRVLDGNTVKNRSGSNKRLRTEQTNVKMTIDELMQISQNALDAGFDSIPAFLRDLGLKAKANG